MLNEFREYVLNTYPEIKKGNKRDLYWLNNSIHLSAKVYHFGKLINNMKLANKIANDFCGDEVWPINENNSIKSR